MTDESANAVAWLESQPEYLSGRFPVQAFAQNHRNYMANFRDDNCPQDKGYRYCEICSSSWPKFVTGLPWDETDEGFWLTEGYPCGDEDRFTRYVEEAHPAVKGLDTTELVFQD